MDVTAAFKGVSTPVHKLVGLIEEQGWEPGKVGFTDGQYTASASFEGEKVERTGPDQATALANVLKVIVRKHHMRSKVQEHLGMEAPQFLDRQEEVAAEYAKAPVYDPKAAIAWKELADDSTRRVETLAEQIAIEYTDDPFPYVNAQELREDVQDKRHLSVTTANADHPVWTLEQMLAFRVVHDVMGYTVAGAEFGWHGENLAFEAHRKLLSHTAQQALFTETIGQVAATTFFGQLPQIKIVFLEAFGEQAPHPGHHPSQTVAPVKHVHAAEGIWGDELHEPEGGWDQWGGEPTWGLAEPCPFCHSKNTGLKETSIGVQGNCKDCFATWKPNLQAPAAPPVGHPLDWTAKVAASQQIDPNQGWQSGIEPHPQNAYLWHGDPLQGHEVMDNASLVDTGWAQFKREDGTPDIERMKQAIVNAFRVVLLSPRKDLRWNAVHYQDIAGVPAGVTDPKVYWDTLETKRRQWNQAQGIDPNAHMVYYKFLKPFESIVLQQNPELGPVGAKQKAEEILYEWWAQEQQRIEQEDADKPAEKQRNADEIERRANEALARRLQQYIKDQFNPKTDEQSYTEQPSLFAKTADKLKDAINESIDYGEGYVNEKERKVQIVLGDADKDELFDRVRRYAEQKYPGYEIEVGSEDYAFRVFRRDDYSKLEPNWKKIAAGEQYNLMTGEAAGKYGAFMGTHLKAISQISQHADELAQAALQDVQEHDGTGHHFRAATLKLGVSGVGPKVCSFAWLLLQPMTSQLGTIDTHMMDVLGHDYEKEMNNRDYFKFERELASGRDAAGYGHIPLGAFQWGMWDYKRTGEGSHQDHSAMRVLDPVPHTQIDWASKALNLKGESWHQQAPQWWVDTLPARQQTSEQWDQNVAPNFSRNNVPYQVVDPNNQKFGKVPARGGPIPWYQSPDGSMWTGFPGQSYAHMIRQVHGAPAHEYWQQPEQGMMGKYFPERDHMVVAAGEGDQVAASDYLRATLSPSPGPQYVNLGVQP